MATRGRQGCRVFKVNPGTSLSLGFCVAYQVQPFGPSRRHARTLTCTNGYGITCSSLRVQAKRGADGLEGDPAGSIALQDVGVKPGSLCFYQVFEAPVIVSAESMSPGRQVY